MTLCDRCMEPTPEPTCVDPHTEHCERCWHDCPACIADYAREMAEERQREMAWEVGE